MLVIVERFEHRVQHYFDRKEGMLFKIFGYVVIFLILFLSKFLILEVVNLVFGDRVELGHFVQLVVLIVTMIVARQIAEWIYRRLGTGNTAGQGV